MDAKETLKGKICEAIDRRRGQIERIGDHIMAHPETGFKEVETSRLAANTMEEFGISPETGLGITGVKGILRGAKPGPTVALIGELDSLVVPDHPMADPDTGAAHACGHNAQMAGLLGAMMGIVDAGAAGSLAGNIVFFAVPAEEYIEVEYRMGLVREGKLEFLGGKPELVRLGQFDDVDIAAMIHTHSDPQLEKSGGFRIVQRVSGENGPLHRPGRARRRGAPPGNQRVERRPDRVGGDSCTAGDVPGQRLDPGAPDHYKGRRYRERGARGGQDGDLRARQDERSDAGRQRKVDRAIRAGAMAVGARVEIETLPGYLPLRNDPALSAIFEANSKALFGAEEVREVSHRTGSTDMGDLSHIMPAIHPYMSGADGVGHSADWHISDKEMGYIAPAKSLALLAVDLLHGDGEAATGLLRDFEPAMTKDEYLTFQRALFKTENFDGADGGKPESRNVTSE